MDEIAQIKKSLNEESAELKNYYPSTENKKNKYVLFSPKISRFILTEKYNPFILFETAQILSSKLSTIVYIISDKNNAPTINNENCLFFSIQHAAHPQDPANINFVRQIARMIVLDTNLYKPGYPADFLEEPKKTLLSTLQEYAMFCLRCMHAINWSINTNDPYAEKDHHEKYYLENFFHQPQVKQFSDNVLKQSTLLATIKNILYECESIEEALPKIIDAWKPHIKQDHTNRLKVFFDILGTTTPKQLYGFILPPEKQTLGEV